MARLPYVDASTASPEVAQTLAAIPALNIFGLMAHAPTAFRPWLRWGATLLTELDLDPVLREIVVLRVAALTPGAEYEWEQHEGIARAVGATDAQIEGARTGAGLEGDAALVARFTDEVVRDAKPAEATFAAATERFSPREIVELLMVIGQYMMVARVMATAEIDLEPPVDPAAFDAGMRAQ
jgi:4-carboxymuconolactone decarboxylase